MNCQETRDRLLDFVDHDLLDTECAEVSEHLSDCPDCRRRHAELRDLVHGLSAARSLDRTQILPRPPDVAPAVIGDFEVLGEIGRGGMGVVYRARQKSLQRIVALKVLSRAHAPSQRAVDRFAREAQAAARLHHTNIVPVYAQGEEDGAFYYAMELIEGESLDQIIRAERSAAEVVSAAGVARGTTSRSAILSRSATLIRSAIGSRRDHAARDEKRVARWVAGVAEGLHHAHEQGVVHRDIKPQNLLLGQDGELHITDFGLARLVDEPSLTLSSEMVGTPAYMSPEQISPQGRRIDRRVDIYSLGVTLFELLTLRRPFDAATYEELIHDVLHREPPSPRRIHPGVSADLETICLRAMDKDASRRFASAAEMARDLRRFAEDVPIQSRRIGPFERAWRWIKRKPAQATALAACLVVALLAPLLWLLVVSKGASQIESAYEILLSNYRDRDAALAELGWMSWVGGERGSLELVQAFADVMSDPKRSIARLEALLRREPDNPDAHYLVAWAHRRNNDAARLSASVAAGDGCAHPPSPQGHFFRGLARLSLDPWDAESSFDQAIAGRNNFIQAMLHQGRAMNQVLYYGRDGEIAYYRKAVSRLEQVCDAQRNRAYPRYLLTITHLRAAEAYFDMAGAAVEDASRERYSAASQLAYRKAFDVAESAIAAEPSSPRGYVAVADYYESRGSFAGDQEAFALAAESWTRVDDPTVIKTVDDPVPEQAEYLMRLLFWLDDIGGAEERAQRLTRSAVGGGAVDPEFYQALLAAARGDRRAAAALLKTGHEIARVNPEARLLIEATGRALRLSMTPDRWEQDYASGEALSPGWHPEFLARLAQRDVHPLEPPVAPSTQPGPDNIRLAAAMHFFIGMDELACGDHEAAATAFEKAWKCSDDEDYCFRAKTLLFKLRSDPGWSPWADSDN